MEKIICNPGFQNLAEKVFLNLDVEDLKNCALLHQSSKQILENPMFWLKKFKNLSMENQKEWNKVIITVNNSDKRNAIISHLQREFKKDALVDLPCYTNPSVQNDFRMGLRKHSKKTKKSSIEDLEIVKMLATLTNNLNAPNADGSTPMYWAAFNEHTEIVKILCPLTNNPNAANEFGVTPIHAAAMVNHIEIVKILAPLTDNPNAPNWCGNTPIYWVGGTFWAYRNC